MGPFSNPDRRDDDPNIPNCCRRYLKVVLLLQSKDIASPKELTAVRLYNHMLHK